MSFQELVSTAQTHYPNLQIKYKNQSLFMKILGNILFFNKEFMDSYTTTVGSTVYFPSEHFLKIRPVSGSIVLLHELMHLSDSNKFSRLLFSFLYLSPQILILLCLPLLLISWKIALLCLIFAAPIPSFFRMYFEKRAYFISLYCYNALSKRLKFNPMLEDQKNLFMKQFKGAYYYFMWPFSLDKEFTDALNKIKNGDKPFEDPYFNILDDLLTKV